MGSEPSKPVQPPDDWQARGSAEAEDYQFQIISPTSDISNPSDIRKLHQTTTVRDRRRTSRVAAKTVPSNRQASAEAKELPAPSSFYFPSHACKSDHRSGNRISTVERDLVAAAAERRASMNTGGEGMLNANKQANKRGFNPLRKLTSCFDDSAGKEGKTERKIAEQRSDRPQAPQPVHPQEPTVELKQPPKQRYAHQTKRSHAKDDLNFENKENMPRSMSLKVHVENKSKSKSSKVMMVPKQTNSPMRKASEHRDNSRVGKHSPQRRVRHNHKHVKEQQQAFREKRMAAAKQKMTTSDPDVMAYHSEDAYFDRLSAAQVEESPAGSFRMAERIPALLPTLSEERTLASSEADSIKDKNQDADSFAQSMNTGFNASESSPEILEETKNEELAVIFTNLKPEVPVELSTTDVLSDFPGANLDLIKSVKVKASSSDQHSSGSDMIKDRPADKSEQEPVSEITEPAAIEREEVAANNVDVPIQNISFHSVEDLDDAHDNQSTLSSESSRRESVGSSTIAAVRMYRTKAAAKNNAAMVEGLEETSREEDSGVSDEDKLTKNDESPPAADEVKETASPDEKVEELNSDDASIESSGSKAVDDRLIAADAICDVSVDESYFKTVEEEHKLIGRPMPANIPEEPIKQVASLGPSNFPVSESPADSEGLKKSKLEKLFRPILPTLSSGKSSASYDPYEIKVTESAPSLIESADYKAIALFPQSSPMEKSAPDTLALYSPSMLSVDSQASASPFLNKHMVSDQAASNATFLFDPRNVEEDANIIRPKPRSNRGSATFSISTYGSRSRLSKHSARSKAITIPIRRESYGSESIVSVESSNSKFSSISTTSSRRVRFESILGASSKPASEDEEPQVEAPAEFKPKISVESESSSSFVSIDVPSIESKFSDLTDTMNDFTVSHDELRHDPGYSPIPEGDNEECEESPAPCSPSPRPRWGYKMDGFDCVATPFLNDRDQSAKGAMNATESPFLRFKAAKNKFAVTKSATKSVSSKGSSKAKEKEPVKVKRRVSGGLVSNRIDELNKRVSVNKIHKSRTSTGSLHFPSDASAFIRTPAICIPSTQAKVKYSDIFSLAEDATVSTRENSVSSSDGQSTVLKSTSSIVSSGSSLLYGEAHSDKENMSLDSPAPSVATVRKHDSLSYSQATSRAPPNKNALYRENSLLSVHSRYSTYSEGESTTLSAIMGKDNEILPFRSGANVVKPAEQPQYGSNASPEDLCLSPTQRTPMQARKWRSLAAAAKQKDSRSNNVYRQALSQKSSNYR